MTKVICRVAYCAHNVSGMLCNAADIEINKDLRYSGEKTDCTTFIPRDFSGSLTSLENVNYSGLIAGAFSRTGMTNPRVNCHVCDCKHNGGDGCCRAAEIEILNGSALSSSETFCASYET